MFLLAAMLAGAGVSADAFARDHAYDIKPGLRAVVTVDGAAPDRKSTRLNSSH